MRPFLQDLVMNMVTKKTLEGITQLVAEKGISERWDFDAKIATIMYDDKLSGDKRRDEDPDPGAEISDDHASTKRPFWAKRPRIPRSVSTRMLWSITLRLG